jgi:hypothetical protein
MTIRIATSMGAVALLSQLLIQGCGSNNPATTAGAAGNTGTPATTDATPVGGSTTPATTLGAAGTTGAAGSTGGTTTPPSTGAGGAAGTTGTSTFQPLCASLLTAAKEAPTKNGICSDPTDPQLCYKSCGPASVGFKSETCTAGVYVEQSGCSFLPDLDYSCYKIPTDSNGTFVVDASCPATVPQASSVCTVKTCVLCNVNGGYLDSGGAAKTGYCVCPEPSAVSGTSKWTCAASTAWPCPAGKGC